LVFLLSVQAFGLQKVNPGILPNQQLRPISIENSLMALAHVLNRWSGHRSYENLVLALAEEVYKHNSAEPLVTTAARMMSLAVVLNRPDLYREGFSVFRALKPDVAAQIEKGQKNYWKIDYQNSDLTIYEKIVAHHTNVEIFDTPIFVDQDMHGENYQDRIIEIRGQDVSDARIQSSEDYIVDALYGSFEDEFGGARQSINNPLVQKIMAGREAESVSAGYQYYQDILADATQAAQLAGAVGGGIGGAIGLAAGGPVGGAAELGVGAGIGAAGGVIVGAVGGAIARHDDYQDAKKAQEEAEKKKSEEEKEKQKKSGQEKADQTDRERKVQARKDEEEAAKLDYAEQVSRTATGVNPDRVDGKGSASLHLLVDLLNRFHKLINVREGAESSQGLIVIIIPNSGSADPGRFEFEAAHGNIMIKADKSGVADPANPNKSRGGGR
ncbi:MAG: hypothetical protein ACXWC9_04255, partial [Pseudobdellovibrionaceae bacterium]